MSNEQVFLSLGSNMGNSLEYLLKAIVFLKEKLVSPVAVSSIYKTEALGNMQQADFLNLVMKAQTSLNPEELLEACQNVERDLDRVRTVHWGPRTMDIDIIFYGKENINYEKLIIPHPRFKERAFVLVPLREIEAQTFDDLNLHIPPQKVDLIITAADVKMKLVERGLAID
ncbi:MAG: 2-amino-4-hydroxy-6-hydroxymethyldihydropteridine diphosphokinase [Clostridia bacterium]|nr:2-amino-4-hydroxy-6-hydroxymethyldihydropteridine diphosphokinase [Clostridia bacterium]MDD4047994.1 2-amino-4-hydroxy-6-hydroxymethyldihydropteridine diphosphokinase [Clostridia bacterium]